MKSVESLQKEIDELRAEVALCGCKKFYVTEEPMDRFNRLHKKLPNGCWQWIGPLQKTGYGSITVRKRQKLAHRFSFEIHKGVIGRYNCVDHLCRNRACVNPDHLESVSMHENIIRGESPGVRQSRQTHCKQGHLYEGNSYFRTDGTRRCKICTYQWSKATRAKQKRVKP